MTVSADKMEPLDDIVRRYQKNGDLPARWKGEGPKLLRFDGIATPDALRNVFRNRMPDGKKPLVYPPNRISIPADPPQQANGWRFSFRVPHEVSVAWGIAPDDLAARIQEACLNATDRTIAFAEKHAAWTRVGHMKYHRAKLIAAVIPQTTSNALGPELQMHVLIAPAGVGQDGVARELTGKPLFRHKMALDAMFRATLAHELHQMGFRCSPAENSFKVHGIPDSLCEHFTKRRPYAADFSGQTRADINVLLARDLATTYGQGRKHLRELWQIEAARLGVTPDTIAAATRPGLMTRFQRFVGIKPQATADASTLEQATTSEEAPTSPSPKVGQILRQSFDTWYVRHAVDRRNNATEFIRHALDTSIGSGIDPQNVLQEIDQWAASELSLPQTPKHQANIKMSQREIAFLVHQMRDDRAYVLHEAVVRKVVSMFSDARNSHGEGVRDNAPEQKKANRFSINQAAAHGPASEALNKEGQSLAVRLTRQRGQVVVVSHRQAQQRELALRAAATAWRAAGYEVTAVTPDRRRAEQLEQSTGIASIPHSQLQLVQGSVSSSRPYSPLQQGNHIEAMFANHVNKDRSHVLVVDQAHQLTLDELKRLVSHTKEHGGKLVLLTPHIDDLPGGRRNMSAVVLNALSERPSEIIGHRLSSTHKQHIQRTEQPRQQGMEMS